MKIKKYDVVIVGAGVSGLWTALNLDQNLNILIVSKLDMAVSNSSLAQGGIAAVLDVENDSYKSHIEDTLKAGSFANDINSVEMLVTKGPKNVEKLIEIGVDFDRNNDGNIDKTLEGGHSKARILHHKDSTGAAIVEKLKEEVLKLKNVTVLEHAYVSRLEKKDSAFYLEILLEDKKEYAASKFVVLVTGGIGRVYEYTTNSAISTGDGIALAYRLGAKIKNMSLIQFHPTAFASDFTREKFLITEALRGEGAYLENCKHQRFMHNYDERLELAPRDVVSKSIILEGIKQKDNHFYLNITHESREFLMKRFPMIFKKCLEEKIDISKDRIPVFPCQHYLMGGIDVDLNGMTSVENLFAAGECSHTGVHGKNRLASNSLLEAVVYADNVAKKINQLYDEFEIDDNYKFDGKEGKEPVITGIRTRVREIMQSSYFVIPDVKSAKEGFVTICDILDMLTNGDFIHNREYYEVLNLATTAYLILREVAH